METTETQQQLRDEIARTVDAVTTARELLSSITEEQMQSLSGILTDMQVGKLDRLVKLSQIPGVAEGLSSSLEALEAFSETRIGPPYNPEIIEGEIISDACTTAHPISAADVCDRGKHAAGTLHHNGNLGWWG